jgi:hypothetical protein
MGNGCREDWDWDWAYSLPLTLPREEVPCPRPYFLCLWAFLSRDHISLGAPQAGQVKTSQRVPIVGIVASKILPPRIHIHISLDCFLED